VVVFVNTLTLEWPRVALGGVLVASRSTPRRERVCEHDRTGAALVGVGLSGTGILPIQGDLTRSVPLSLCCRDGAGANPPALRTMACTGPAPGGRTRRGACDLVTFCSEEASDRALASILRRANLSKRSNRFWAGRFARLSIRRGTL
jgi:hypothetical protein